MSILDEFVNAYIQAALWSSTDDNDEPLDRNGYAIDESVHDRSITECAAFLDANRGDIGDQIASAGHCFWLTRNGHGTGFWDRPEVFGEEQAKRLAAAATVAGSRDLYVGDDGTIYLYP